MRFKISKSKFFAEQIEYLAPWYWITRQGIQPMRNKVKAILNIEAPKTRKELRQFIGIVNYYCDILFGRSELLARFYWIASHQEGSSLNGTHPFNRPLIKTNNQESHWNWEFVSFSAIQTSISLFLFRLYTDASDQQLGIVVIKARKPISFYSWKLNTVQKRYTTTEREEEFLWAIETCKEYKNILLGYPIIVFTDHDNNTFNCLNASDHVLHWLLPLENLG
jgi:hypothetical protein